MSNRWESMPPRDLLSKLRTTTDGLADSEVRRRFSNYGPNQLEEAPASSLAELFAKQFQDFMVMVLLAATIISAFLGETIDAVAILAIVFTNAILGFMQEYKAERSLEALKRLTAPKCKVRRAGRQREIEASSLVPGDIVILEAGDKVPADCRLLSTNLLQTNESALTGESLPVEKDANWTAEKDAGIGDRKNMAFMGTTVTQGRGEAVVVATGMNTEIGQIADMIRSTAAEPTPLQRKLEQLGKWLVLACLVIVGIVFLSGVARGLPPYRMFLTAVSLAVAAIPEGLPAVVTIALAIGVQRMIKRNAIVRRLPAVETLGCATVICSDKTGTLTKNEMTVRVYWTPHREIEVAGIGYKPEGPFFENASKVNPGRIPELWTGLLAGSLCNHAELIPPSKDGGLWGRFRRNGQQSDWSVVGDPTEGALLSAALKGGITDKVRRRYTPIYEIPFDSDRKMMTVVTKGPDGNVSWMKGAPDVIISKCRSCLANGEVVPLTPALRRSILKANERLAGRALRVLALSYKPLPSESVPESLTPDELEDGAVFVALAGMIDPPRPEVKKAIQTARRAGIRTLMVTGDHKATALAIARELGLDCTPGALTGNEMDSMPQGQFDEAVQRYEVYARVSPKHKLRIVQSLKKLGEVVAMTGDGVNDAPAVKEADIGIAMGRMGTEVTKEASAIVLADDNYATIVAAVEEGRGIYDNIRKFIRYLLSCNVGEVLTMFLATLAGLPMPLIPVQILWMNLVTDGLPAIALGVDPPGRDVMKRPPRPPKEGVFARRLHLKILFRGTLIGICTLGVFTLSLAVNPGDVDRARTLAFTTLVMSQLFYVFQCRTESSSAFEAGFFSNWYLLGAVLTSTAMQAAAVYLPFAQRLFRTVPLDGTELVLVLFFSGWSLVLDGIIRAVRRILRQRTALVRVRL